MTENLQIWWVLVRRDNGYPVLIYPDQERAEQIAKSNGYDIVSVTRYEEKGGTAIDSTD